MPAEVGKLLRPAHRPDEHTHTAPSGPDSPSSVVHSAAALNSRRKFKSILILKLVAFGMMKRFLPRHEFLVDGVENRRHRFGKIALLSVMIA